MRALLIDNGKVAGEFYGQTVEALTASNPGAVFVKDLSGLNRVMGMACINGVLSGAPSVEPAPITPVPAQILMVQARLALEDAGLLDTVTATMEAMTGKAGKAARIKWQFAGELKRDQSSVLGLTPAQLDAVFIAGAKL